MYDMYAPLLKPCGEIEYEKALEIIAEGLTPLAGVYLHHEARLFQGWIDVYENEGKTSGAYSSEVTTAILIYC